MSNNRKRGFTLVEVIVVLVILAILAAVLIPTLTGYIDKAKEKTAVAECRQCVVAAQTILSEEYGKTGSGELTISGDGATVLSLSQAPGSFFSEFGVDSGKLTHLYYADSTGEYQVTYCSLGGCAQCGGSTTYTVNDASGGGGGGSGKSEQQKKLDTAAADIFTALQAAIDDPSVKFGNNVDSISINGVARNAILNAMPAESRQYMENCTWRLLYSSNYGWRLYFTDENYSASDSAKNVTVYKYSPDYGYQVTHDGTITNGVISSPGKYENAQWVDSIY